MYINNVLLVRASKYSEYHSKQVWRDYYYPHMVFSKYIYKSTNRKFIYALVRHLGPSHLIRPPLRPPSKTLFSV